jgi:hypothetical protein
MRNQRQRQWRRAIPRLLATATIGATTLAPTTTASDSGVSAGVVRAGRLDPCHELYVRGLNVHGGCQITIDRRPMRLSVASLFGHYRLARCGVEFSMRVGPTGAIAMNSITLSPLPTRGRSACGDIGACRQSFKGESWNTRLPWTGQMTNQRGNRVHAYIDICLDSCLGRFEGRIHVDFKRDTTGAWRMSARTAPAGTSGMTLTGSWNLRPLGGHLKLKSR